MKLSKKIPLRNEAVRWVLIRLGSLYIRLVRVSGRWTVVRGETPQRYWDEGKPFVLAFWHGRMMMAPYCWNRDKDITMLVSEHPDGQLGARIMARLGIKSVAGSSTRGGSKALRGLLKIIKDGGYAAIAPDGPRGPRMRAGDGVLAIARLSGAPIIPVAFSVTRGKNLRSWDRHLVAFPLARGVFVWGEAIKVSRDASDDELKDIRRKVEDALNTVTAEADILSGRKPIEPAPEGAPP